MTQLEYFNPKTALVRSHRVGLIVWGILSVLLGVSFLVAAAFAAYAAILSVYSIVIPRQPAPPLDTLCWTTALYLSLGLLLLQIGLACCRGRRWLRPAVVASCVVAMVSVIPGVVLELFYMGQTLSLQMSRPLQPDTLQMVLTNEFSYLLFVAFTGTALPAILLWFFGRKSMQEQLNRLSPSLHWTDRLSMPQTIWVIACFMLALRLMSEAIGGFTPMLTFVFKETLNSELMVGLVLIFAAAGLISIHRFNLGWLMGMAILAALEVASICFWAVGDQKELQHVANNHLPPMSRHEILPLGIIVFASARYLVFLALGIWVRVKVRTSPAE